MSTRDRTKFVGASEVAAVMGISPYKTPLQCWAEKTGEVQPPDLSDNQAVEWGTRLERLVSKKFAEEHGVKLIAYKKRYVHPEYPFLSCELDNIIAGTDSLVEIKTVNAWAWSSWENAEELPDHVVVQVMMQLGLSKRKKGWIACLCGGQKYIEKCIEFDQEMYEGMVEKCAAFWEMVKNKIPPVAESDDNSFMIELFPTAGADLKEASADMDSSIALLQEMKGQIKDLIADKSEIEAKIKAVIGENLGLDTPEYIVKWIPVKGSTFTVVKKDSRMLKVKKKG